jgi:hypothetical protein
VIPAKASTEARGRQITEGWQFGDWLASGSTFCSSGQQDVAVNVAVDRSAIVPGHSANENHASAESSWKPIHSGHVNRTTTKGFLAIPTP